MSNKLNLVNRITVILLVFAVLFFACDASACKRKGDFGCCGNGRCNIFCRNCDGGCNKTCENTSCNDVQWGVCAGVCTGCATACAVSINAEACVVCMGVSYESCKGCLSTSESKSVQGEKPSSSERDEFFKSIANYDGNYQSMSLADFTAFVQKEIKRTGNTKTTATIEEMFKAFDVNGDRLIDRSEFDNESVDHGFVE